MGGRLNAADITGVVLAGGEGRRMGGADKGLQLLDGRPMIARVLERLQPQVGQVVISANRNLVRYREFGCPVVVDQVPDFAGPLAGLQAVMTMASTQLLLSTPCDSPYLPADLVVRLRAALDADGADLAVPRAGDRVHRAFCLTRRELLPRLDGFLAGGGRRLGLWHESLNTIEVDFDDQPEAFGNINSLADLDQLAQVGS